jgi:hypothetical protein
VRDAARVSGGEMGNSLMQHKCSFWLGQRAGCMDARL